MPPRAVEVWDRRLRRLTQIASEERYGRTVESLRQFWERSEQRPTKIRVRGQFVHNLANGSSSESPPPAARLLRRRGIAMRLYLLAIFEAQCRLAPGRPLANNTRPLNAQGQEPGWSDLVAIDASYSARHGDYLVDNVKNHRTTQSRTLEQVKGALRTLEKEDLVGLETRKARHAKDYAHFALMSEAGRGVLPTPRAYSVPSAGQTIDIPHQFFVHGWIHVLQPSEIFTWLVLNWLRGRFPGSHEKSGVFLYGKVREEVFGLKRDSYEDGCAILEGLGLIKRVYKPTSLGTDESDEFSFAITLNLSDPVRFEPHRYQVMDEGLEQNAMRITRKFVQTKLHEERGRASHG
jgi:hypothetical protein